jgi:translation initiation factor 5A
MSDDDHHFESKADAGASKTFPQQAGTIRKNAYLVIKTRPCKVVEVSTSKTGKHGHAKCHFVAIDIFTGKKLEDIVPSSHNCDVPEVVRTDYQLIDISEDGFVSCFPFFQQLFPRVGVVGFLCFVDNGSVLLCSLYINVLCLCVFCSLRM